MCGRFTLRASDEELSEFFDLSDGISLAPRYNIAPSQNICAIRASTNETKRKIGLLHWGLIPPWAEDKRIAYRMINARTETVQTKPAFRDAFRAQRCLIPANGYYEWKTSGKEKLPFLMERPDQNLLALAGLWAQWNSPEGELIESCTILTTEATPRLAEVHARMPLFMAPENFDAWLAPNCTPAPDLLKPYPHDDLRVVPVSTYLNSAAHEDEKCMSPREEAQQLELLG